MKYPLLAAVLPGLLLACSTNQSTDKTVKSNYSDLPISADELTRPQWQTLSRFPPRYPKKEAMARNSGCATVEYVITANNMVTGVHVIESSSTYFAKEAQQVVNKWDWAALPTTILEKPVKTQTRFEFCLENGSGNCAMDKLQAKQQCPGSDVIASVGSVVRKRDL
ncbi:energy transducer TonB [Alteromonas lipolytica]|uniref:TonB C-terminal domain-containing protein n=1 Tax=Alteromonas lipolytica TaxID=1856405 RepID=A0A1E8FIX1_9ALTE|nr:energy transducer TonB [Alteromonas lipolytica]OFI35864.1 hypothetical protein BFC17_11345 [Alteromonas lipolytica]GGF81470.1 biopolymer transporter TonB [Alteromonas lipolytica]